MADDMRDRIADAITARLSPAQAESDSGISYLIPPTAHDLADAVLAVVGPEVERHEAEVERLRYERRLLGAARMTLDLVAAGAQDRWEQARQEAGDLAQRIVDEIGHPVTDEPALGPSYRAERDALKAATEHVRGSLDWLIAIGFGAREADLRDLRAALDQPTDTTGETETPDA